MYSKNFLNDFSNFEYTMNLLKRHKLFSQKCHQIELLEGRQIEFDIYTPKLYFIQEGYTKLAIQYGGVPVFIFLSKRGEFPFLRVRKEVMTDTKFTLQALSKCILWEIDREFFYKVIQIEDPRNIILMNYQNRVARTSILQIIMNSLSAHQRIYYMLRFLGEKFGIQQENGEIELPGFLTYEKLGELTAASNSSVSGVLTELVKKDIISVKRKRWVLKKPTALVTDIPYGFSLLV